MTTDNTVTAPDAEDATSSTGHAILTFWTPSSDQKLLTGRCMRSIKPGPHLCRRVRTAGKMKTWHFRSIAGDRPSLTDTGKTGSPQHLGRGSSVILPQRKICQYSLSY